MKFALLGDDPAVLPLLASIAARPQHDLAWALTSHDFLPAVRQLFPRVNAGREWIELFAEPVDAVLVAGADAYLLEGAKRLGAAGKKLVVFPQSGQQPEWVYELLLLDEGETALVPVFLHRVHPVLRALRGLMDGGAFGKVHQLQLERELAVPSRHGIVPRLSSDGFDAALLPDVDLLRMLGGEYNEVTAMLTGGDGSRFALATVTLAGDGLPEVLWALKPCAGDPSWSMKLSGELGSVQAKSIGGVSAIELNWQGIAMPSMPELDRAAGNFDAGAATLDELEAALAGNPSAFGRWTDLARDVDLVDGAHRSIRKRRTIDLHFETTSERSQFKTQMAAAGCGVLVVTLLAVIMVLIAGAALDPRSTTEVAAEAADAIVPLGEFKPNSPEPTPTGRKHLREIAERASRLPDRRFPVLVEEAIGSAAPGNEGRRLRVVDELTKGGMDRAAEDTVAAPVRGRGFGTTMRVVRIAVWMPLLLFLLLQGLLFVARPAPQPGRAASDQQGPP